MVRVTFEYDSVAKRWQPIVKNAENQIEARHAFAAVVLTCQMLNPDLLDHTKVEANDDMTFKITPAV